MKTTKNTILIALAVIPFFTSCCTNDCDTQIKGIKTCMQKCDDQETECNAEWKSCIEPAWNTYKADMGRCMDGPPSNLQECMVNAMNKYENATEGCSAARSECRTSVSECRGKCLDLESIKEP